MLISDDPIKRQVPHEPGQWFEFRRLSAARLRKARRKKAGEQQEDAAALFKILGPEFMSALRNENREDRDRIVRELEELEYHVSQFDIPTLLKEGVVSWSYDGKLPSDVDDPSELLDEKTTVWAAKEIVAITRPPTEEEEGNS